MYKFALNAHYFLAITDQQSNETLVLEGWIPSSLVSQLAEQYQQTPYKNIVISKDLTDGLSPYESGEFVAKYVRKQLISLGIPEDRVHIVFYPSTTRDRTYQSAIATLKWLKENGLPTESIDVGTLGAHGRRSRYLFQKAFGSKSEVGVISFKDGSYDSSRWWRSSSGIRTVPFELLAFLYVRFFFEPEMLSPEAELTNDTVDELTSN